MFWFPCRFKLLMISTSPCSRTLCCTTRIYCTGARPSTSSQYLQLSFNKPLCREFMSHIVVRVITLQATGARRLNPPRPSTLPTWDLGLVLDALTRPHSSLYNQRVCERSLLRQHSCSRWPLLSELGTCRRCQLNTHVLSSGQVIADSP